MFTLLMLMTACDDEGDGVSVKGCTYSNANNYNPDANEDDGSCIFDSSILEEASGNEGCTDMNALNYDANANEDDGTCAYYTDKLIGNYAATATCITNPFGSEIQTYDTEFSFVVSHRSYNQVNMVGFADCSDTLIVSVSESLSLVAPDGDCVWQVAGNYDEANQTITFTHPTGFGDCEGTAIKQ